MLKRGPRIAGLLMVLVVAASCRSGNGGGNGGGGGSGPASSVRGIEDAAVVVLDPEGTPLAGAAVHFRCTGLEDYEPQPIVTGRDGLASIRNPGSDPGYDIVVVCRGHRSAMLQAFVGNATLQLVRSVPSHVRIVLNRDAKLRASGVRLDVRLEWMSADGGYDPRILTPLPGPVGAQPDTFDFEVEDPGEYIVGVWEVGTARLDPAGGADSEYRWEREADTDPRWPTVSVGTCGESQEVELLARAK